MSLWKYVEGHGRSWKKIMPIQWWIPNWEWLSKYMVCHVKIVVSSTVKSVLLFNLIIKNNDFSLNKISFIIIFSPSLSSLCQRQPPVSDIMNISWSRCLLGKQWHCHLPLFEHSHGTLFIPSFSHVSIGPHSGQLFLFPPLFNKSVLNLSLFLSSCTNLTL